jgi:16S rRNA (adenine1518-N6/adenine1519-N6)-dimethyltransferase
MIEAGISARRSLGQHFLTSEAALRRIAGALEVQGNETIIEIGAGLGALTAHLAATSRHVIAIELDKQLAAYLERRFADASVRVLRGDATVLDPVSTVLEGTGRSSYVVAGNLPYNVAQPVLRRYLEARPPPRRLVLMVQREVAKSIVAGPPAMTLLGVSVQVYGTPRILSHVPPSAFYPAPKVQSSVVRIDTAQRPRVAGDKTDAFFDVVRAGFSTKRKQLRNALANGLSVSAEIATSVLADADIDPARRAQELSLEEWTRVAHGWAARGASERPA